jgi:hypothetical protein
VFLLNLTDANMKKSELMELIREELYNVLQEEFGQGGGISTSSEEELDEKTIARHEPPRKMTQSQVQSRDTVGKKLSKNKRAVSYFKKKFGDDWKSYMWATATNRAIAGKKAGKGKDKKD